MNRRLASPIIALALVAAACGGGSDDPAPTTAPPKQSVLETTTTTAAPTPTAPTTTVDPFCAEHADRIATALAAIDMEITDLVRLNGYITAEGDVGIYRDVRDRWAGGHAAASTLVEVAALASPAWHVEIEAVAAKS